MSVRFLFSIDLIGVCYVWGVLRLCGFLLFCSFGLGFRFPDLMMVLATWFWLLMVYYFGLGVVGF